MIYKKRNIIAILSFFVSLIVCYFFAISTTLDHRKEYKKLVNEEANIAHLHKELAYIKSRQKYLDSILSSYETNSFSLHNSLLETINAITNTKNLKIYKFNEPHIFEQDNIVTKTYSFSLEGSYNDLLKMVHILEQKANYGEIIHLGFERKKNFKSGKFYLRLNVMLQTKGANIQI